MTTTLPSRPAAARPRRKAAGTGARTTGRPLTGLLFVTPTALIVIAFFVVPLGIMLFMSLSDWPLLGSPSFAGFDNYAKIFHDKLFLSAITFTLVYTGITTVVVFGISFVLVAISNSPRRGAKFYRTAFFLPYVLGTASAALLWGVDANDQVGVFNRILQDLGILSEPAGFLATPAKALFTVIAMVVWKFIGFQVVVLLVALRSVPAELYEAAKLDGANAWARLRYITLPYLRPTLTLLFMLSVAGSVLAFDQFYVLTQGGPANSTVTVVLDLYNTAFSHFKLGTAAAMSVVLLIALVLINAVQLRLRREKGDA
ncbi:carbohydrate ABC transporter permease [Amycolatopsis jejuensis]|uniref:carbohydrate ABC transporter permease n=1 Tax=Amycolatopsis jejuensis TaxID=330084 RepID=UPI000524777A|nr:sugar ABC transporter permease [Amycolatopsis jejuensis]